MVYSLYIDNRKADLSNDVDISLTYTSIDLSSPEAIKNSFSKSIVLKGTPNNNQIFGLIYKLDRSTINEEDLYSGINFDARKRTPFILYYNGELIESGYFQLDEISLQNHVVNYSITLYGELGNFFYNLKYTDAGDERKLYDLTFANEEEFNDRSKNKWNISFILDGWRKLGLTNNKIKTSINSKLTDNIVAVPTYSGYYDGDFDNNKIAVNLNSINSELSTLLKDSTSADGTKHSNYAAQNDWTIIEAPRDLDEWEVKDLRCKYQRPAYKTSWVLDAISNSANNGGYTLEWDEDILNSPYYKDSWVLRNRLTNDADDDLSSANYLQVDLGGNSINAVNHYINTTSYALINTDGLSTTKFNPLMNCLVNSFVFKIETPQLDKSTKFLTCWEKNLWDIGPYQYNLGPFGSRSILCISGIELTISVLNRTRNKTIRRKVFIYSNLNSGQYGYKQTEAFRSFHEYTTSLYDESQNIILTKTDKNHSEWYYNDVYYINDESFKEGDNIIVLIGAESKKYFAKSEDEKSFAPLTFNSDEPLDRTLYVDPVLGKRVFFGGVQLKRGYNNKYTNRNEARIRDNRSIVLSNNSSFQSGFMEDYLNENNEFVLSKRKLFSNDDLTPFDFLTSFSKMLNLKFLPDIGTKTIKILPFNKFYTNELIDLNNKIDRSQDIIINPNVAESLQYRWQLAENENYANNIIKKTYGINEGEYIKNTGYQFSKGTNEVLNDILFKNTVLYQQSSIFYSKIPLTTSSYPFYYPAVLLCPTYKQTFYNNANLDSIQVDKVGKGGNFNSPLYRQQDTFPKLCCFNDENQEVEDLDLVLVYFDGYYNTSFTNEYILSENIQTIIKMNDYKNLHLYSNSESYISDFANDLDKIAFLNQVPYFSKSKNYKYLLDFNNPIHSFINDTSKYTSGDNLYGRFWQRYIDDLYSPDNKKITLRCFPLPNKPYEALRKFYTFNNTLWILNEITDYDPSKNEAVECTFIKVDDMENYTSSYSEPVKSRPFITTTTTTTQAPSTSTTTEEAIDQPLVHAKPNTNTLASVVDEYMKGELK